MAWEEFENDPLKASGKPDEIVVQFRWHLLYVARMFNDSPLPEWSNDPEIAYVCTEPKKLQYCQWLFEKRELIKENSLGLCVADYPAVSVCGSGMRLDDRNQDLYRVTV